MKSLSHKARIVFAIRHANYIAHKYGLLFPPSPLIHIARGEGLKVFEVELKSGYTDIFFNFANKSIYINEDLSIQEKRFILAREIGHYLMHYNLLRDEENLDINSSFFRTLREDSNMFAINLLIPTELLAFKIKEYKNLRDLKDILCKDFIVSDTILNLKLSLKEEIEIAKQLEKSHSINHTMDYSYTHYLTYLKEKEKLDFYYEIEEERELVCVGSRVTSEVY